MKTGIHAEYSMSTGSNPPYGASINYFLPEASTIKPTIFILNQQGDTIHRINGNGDKGVNRVWWNLAHDEIKLPSLKTKPDGKEFVKLDSLGNRNMFIYDLDIAPGLEAPRVKPGNYSVVLKVGNEILKANLLVIKDPNSGSNELNIDAQYIFGKSIYDELKHCLAMIEKMELKRANLISNASATSIDLEKKIYELESRLFDVHQTGARMDIFRNPAKIFERMLTIGKESIANGADFPPTSQQRTVFASLKEELKKVEQEYNQLVK
jgi:hypothetical protein